LNVILSQSQVFSNQRLFKLATPESQQSQIAGNASIMKIP
jgi:hypothetical protein